MKGLLLKEWYTAVKYCRMFLLVFVVFFAVAAASAENIFFLAYPCVLAGMMPMTLIAYDERSRWDVYANTFPYTRAQLVSAKYIIALVLVGFAWLATAAMLLLSPAYALATAEFKLLMLCVEFLCGFTAPSITLPFIFKYGSEKGRIAYYAVIILLCAALAALGAMGGSGAASALSGVTALTSLGGGALYAAPVLLAALLYAGSWLLSIRIYQKRAF